MRRLRSIPYLILSILFYVPVHGQNNDIELTNVIVTASLAAQQQKETGRNVIVFKGAHFKDLPVHSIDELLRYLPGIEVQQRGPQGSQSDIVIRGGTFQQVLVIIDGVKLNDPLTGHFSMFIPIHPAEIERVEILKGAASATWGSEAVGGVVNIITKTFAGSKDSKIKTIKAKLVAGEYGLLNADGYFNWTKNKSTISGGLLSNNADGQPLRGAKGFFHLTTAHLAFSQQLPRNWTLSFRTAADFRKFNAQNFYTTFTSDTAKEEVNSWWNHLNLVKKTANGQLNIDVAYKRLKDEFWFTPHAVPNNNKTRLFSSQVFYTAPFNKKNSYTVGVQGQRKSIRSNDRGDHHLWHGAVYSILRHKAGDFYINESARLDWDENYGIVFIPQLNLAWAPSKITIRASAGRSFRDADFTERYNNYNKPVVLSGSIGHPFLNAESSWNLEAGVDYNLSAKFRVSSSVFYRHHDDLVDWVPTPYNDMPRKDNLVPTGTYALAKNVEEVKTSGAELDILFNDNIGRHSHVLATAGFTWLDSKSDAATPSFYISSHAKFLANFSVVYRIHAFSFAVNGIYKKRNERKAAAIQANITPTYFVCNVKAGYQLPKKIGKLFVQADNVFDKQYSDLLGAPMPGRWLSGGFEIAL